MKKNLSAFIKSQINQTISNKSLVRLIKEFTFFVTVGMRKIIKNGHKIVSIYNFKKIFDDQFPWNFYWTITHKECEENEARLNVYFA